MGIRNFFTKHNKPTNESAPSEQPNEWDTLSEMQQSPEANTTWEDLSEEPFAPEAHETAPETLPTPEEKEKSLTFENLSQLSTAEYLEKWRTLNPFFVTHVTRQGIRDHNSMIYHSAGMGEFQNGFKNIVESGKNLQSPAEIRYGIGKNFTEDDVAKFLDQELFSDKDTDIHRYSAESLVDSLPLNASMGAADTWADKQAIHFAQHTVLNETYGGENGNEAFFVFPTDVIASQCRFGGHMHDKDLTTAQTQYERKWNDLFVWEDSSRSIPIDAGLTFLPNSQPVDRETGSKYATEEITTDSGETVRVPVKDEKVIQAFSDCMKSFTPDSKEMQFYDENGNHNIEPLVSKLAATGIASVEDIRKLLAGGSEYSFRNFAENGDFGNVYLYGEEREAKSKAEIQEMSIENWLRDHNLGLKLAENPVPASEYWEKYFTEHPEAKPAHIIYYDGDPTKAVTDLLAKNGILEETYSYSREDRDHTQNFTGTGDSVERDGKLLGFESHYVENMEEDADIQAEHKRFNEIAKRVIEEKQ